MISPKWCCFYASESENRGINAVLHVEFIPHLYFDVQKIVFVKSKFYDFFGPRGQPAWQSVTERDIRVTSCDIPKISIFHQIGCFFELEVHSKRVSVQFCMTHPSRIFIFTSKKVKWQFSKFSIFGARDGRPAGRTLNTRSYSNEQPSVAIMPKKIFFFNAILHSGWMLRNLWLSIDLWSMPGALSDLCSPP